MPRLILFAACEKVILDAQGLASLITLIEKVHVGVPPGVDVSRPIAIPMHWSVITIWRVENDEASQYEQKVEIFTRSGDIAMHTEPQRLVPGAPSSTGVKIISSLTAVPISDGPLELRLSCRRIGDPAWQQEASYPIDVALVRQE
ncbi:MAG TPA: hypothetical protein VJ732_19095 [Bryobacteraceae bacterium]|nr:hypothetical protein [Bryobacteraceae bacterium]